MGNVSDKSCRESKNSCFKYNNFFPRKWCPIRDTEEKYGTVRQVTDDNIIRRMRISCWVTKATDIHSEYVIILAFPQVKWLFKAPQYWVIRTFPVSLYEYFTLLRSVTHCSRACHQRDCVLLRLHIVADKGVYKYTDRGQPKYWLQNLSQLMFINFSVVKSYTIREIDRVVKLRINKQLHVMADGCQHLYVTSDTKCK